MVVAVAACGDDEADPLERVEQPVLDIDVSRQSVCLLVTEDLPEEVEELPTIGCDVPHTHEIYASVEDTEQDVLPHVTDETRLTENGTSRIEAAPYVVCDSGVNGRRSGSTARSRQV